MGKMSKGSESSERSFYCLFRCDRMILNNYKGRGVLNGSSTVCHGKTSKI